MADDPKRTDAFTPEQLRKAKGDFDPSALAHEDEQQAEAASALARGKPQPTADELAEQQRRDDKAMPNEGRTRDEYLTEIGRARDTTGRLGGNS